MRLGLLGGTFDPIHVGHLDVALAACRAVPLDRVILVPSHVPPHRSRPHASSFHRFAMAALAAEPHEMLAVTDLEMHTDGPSYTADTLTRLAAHGVDTRSLCFITGADAFRDIRSWKEYPALLDRCHFVVVSRPGSPVGDLRAALPELAGRMHDTPCALPSDPCIFLVDAMTSPISSTEVRRRIAEGLSIDDLVPAGVASHIRKHDLYAAHARKGFA